MKIKILYADFNNFYGHSMSQPLPSDEIKFDKIDKLEDILKTPEGSDIGYFVEVDLRYLDKKKIKQKISHLLLKIKLFLKKNIETIQKIQPKKRTKSKILICVWSDIMNYFLHYRLLKFFVRYGMLVDKIHEILSFIRSKWLEKCINFNTQRLNRAKNEFEIDFYNLLKNAFYGKTMEIVRNRLRLECIKKDDYKKNETTIETNLRRNSKII